MERIIGIGIDLVDVRRIEELWQRHPQRFLQRLLSSEEQQALLQDSPYSAMRLAGRWSAKEAISKALGSGFRGFNMNDIEVFNDDLGMPYVRLQRGALERAERIGAERMLLTISHEREMAMAQAIALGAKPLQNG